MVSSSSKKSVNFASSLAYLFQVFLLLLFKRKHDTSSFLFLALVLVLALHDNKKVFIAFDCFAFLLLVFFSFLLSCAKHKKEKE
ncbi:hypothetical protein EDC96DRAFT_532354 [Choanephora cucurbitarum]|nr:hypothetical protein EDC96DRAFT_532354 [Choanephora cucurbitarum]